MKRLVLFIFFAILPLFAKEAKMEVFSPAFENGGFIPAKYTCDGDDISIPLIFKNVSAKAKSLALVMDDPDAPMGVFVHWVIYDIPVSLEGLPEGVPNAPELEQGIKQGRNDFGNIGYGGPCPPNGAHRYYIKVYALDRVLEAKSGLSKHQLLQLIRPFVIDQAVLMGIYER